VSSFDAALYLENGELFLGKGFGYPQEMGGEVVFNTAMFGYQEVFSDPSYANQIVILGGIDKGADFAELIVAMQNQTNIKNVILIGEIKQKLYDMFAESNVNVHISDAKSMAEIVAEATALASSGDVVVLSPACASFDMFKNFYDRGDQFRAVVQSL
jgi:UDP-N-acetylmuramoylalanine--D-glutamate ligase